MKIQPSLRKDLPAGVVVFFVAVPLCLGIALASGAPLFSGLIAGMVGGIVVGALSGSPLGVSGPAAGLAVVVVAAIAELKSFEVFLVAVVLGGVIQIVLGFLRAGVLGHFFPSAVIKGMLSGIGILIVLKQIPHAVGWDEDPMGDLGYIQPDGQSTLTELPLALGHVVPAAALIAVVALLVLVLWEKVLAHRGRFFQIVQGPLVAVGLGVLYEVLTERFAPSWSLAGEHLVNVPVLASLSEFPSLFTMPDWSGLANPTVWSTAFVLAIVASIETLLCVEAADKLDEHRRTTPKDRELLAQGVGNIVSGLIGGLPVTQVIVRSSANIQSGGQTKLSTIVHGILIVVFVFLLPGVLNLIPLSVLAAVLILVGYKLAKPQLFLAMWRKGMSQFAPFALTIAGMIFTDLLTGVLMGLGLAVVLILSRSYRNVSSMQVETTADGRRAHVHMRLAEDVNFLNRGAIVRQLGEIPDGAHVTIDMRRSLSVDQDVLELFEEFEKGAPERRITFEVLPRDPSAAPAAA